VGSRADNRGARRSSGRHARRLERNRSQLTPRRRRRVAAGGHLPTRAEEHRTLLSPCREDDDPGRTHAVEPEIENEVMLKAVQDPAAAGEYLDDPAL
jgi:hypothetical protein